MIKVKCKNLDVKQIADSGQCFRWYKIDEYKYKIFHLQYSVIVSQKDDNLYFDCSQDEFHNVWKSYFDLDTDYSFIINNANTYYDNYLLDAISFASGMRILRQDYWESIVSFIISQNNNIPRIKKTIQRLCELNNNQIPSAEQLLLLDISKIGLGYRDKYLKSAAEWWISDRNDILDIKGVGEKVANCIRLYGEHDLSSCPIDVWMKKIINEDYKGKMPNWIDSEYAGVYQQFIFYYKRERSR